MSGGTSSSKSRSNNSKGEAHRIYWQQWISASSTAGSASPERKSRRELITSSAAVRMAGAKAVDVTQLLRTTLGLGQINSSSSSSPLQHPDEQDSLVLVGTLYSLPRDHMQFEHELTVRTNPSTTTGSAAPDAAPSTTTSSNRSTADPFHVVQTLRPDDDPIQVRRWMHDYLQQQLQQQQHSHSSTMRTIIAPKLQWFFVPAAVETNSPIPNCVELDGYCTSLESEHEEEEDNDDEEEEELDQDHFKNGDGTEPRAVWRASVGDNNDDDLWLLTRFPWLAPATVRQRASSVLHPRAMQQRRQEALFQQLSYCQSLMPHRHCRTGYLLKRSRRDPHVWRRVYCVLTYEYLWYVSRIYHYKNHTDRDNNENQYCYAKHGRIRLTRALLLEPSADYIPLYRTPNSFQVVSGQGTSHWFRAATKTLQSRWIQALSERMVQSFENGLMDQAELIVADECLARNRRMAQVAVEPLLGVVGGPTNSSRILQQQQQPEKELLALSQSDPNDDSHEKHDNDSNSSSDTGRTTLGAAMSSAPNQEQLQQQLQQHVRAVLRWGMQVATYRERCRYIHASLPAKSPVVVVRGTPAPRCFSRENSVRSNSGSSSGNINLPFRPDPIDPAVQAMIQTTWRTAAELLTTGTRLALQIQQPKLSHSLETACQHIDYIIHGRFRSSSCDQSVERSEGDHVLLPSQQHERDPPPADLMDHLLSELQSIVTTRTALLEPKRAVSASATINGDFSSAHP